MSKWKWFFIGCGALAPVLWAATYLATINSTAFAVASEYAKTAPNIVAAIGPVDEIGLKPFGYEVHTRDDSGRATMLLKITGRNGTGTAEIYLKRDLRVWRVTDLRFAKTE